MQKLTALLVEFLGERKGEAEEGLKTALMEVLAADASVRKAFLARVSYNTGEESGAVCLVADPRTRNEANIMERCTEIFRTKASGDEQFDILFLTAEQEARVEAVCAPFLVR